MKRDILGRTEFVDSIIDFVNILSTEKKGCCFSIDGKWGTGKTYVLDMLEERLKEIQSEVTSDNQYFVFHYNSWKYDYYEEPLVAIVAAMQDEIEDEKSIWNREVDGKLQAGIEVAKTEVKKMVGKLAEKHIGVNIVKVVDGIRDANSAIIEEKVEYDNYYGFKKAMIAVRESMNKIAKEKTVILVVDELDRCMPEYAIKVLERLHHIFENIENIVVIIAVDSEQLESSIRTIYGEKTKSKDYMKKIIDITFKLDAGKISLGVYEKYESFFMHFKEPDEGVKEEIEEIFSNIWKGIDIRTQEKAMSKIETLHSLIEEEKLDICVALFEIFVIRYYWLNNGDLTWLPLINIISYDDILEKLGVENRNYLRKLQEKALSGKRLRGMEREKAGLLGDLVGMLFWLLVQAYSANQYFFLDDKNKYEDEIRFVKQFVKLVSIIE
ncbi:KAP family P-loop NTPase fold protein [Faecalicatena contorta]|uniref:KAP family P-loop NTPase fold protein n=1 Tax=Faecalicatena contorta TaxID=39482 RepID=UPI001F19184A|nr:P-loop NTPase fold protein [Faecalicatena contorta]MCF2554392.1 hypothetical protein [Faecalicatena contorta]